VRSFRVSELTAAFHEDLCRIDAHMRDTTKQLTTAVATSGTTLTETFNAGPIVAATNRRCPPRLPHP
jgi:hypothetical protein